ncbi:hypothetical protein ACFL47_05175 [Candidatus Latescibacterota bacterium]
MAGKITYTSPGRCGIVGNPSDMYGGSVISCSTAERAAVSIEDYKCIEIEVAGETRTIMTPADLQQDGGMFDAVLAAIEYFELGSSNIRITVKSDIPVRAGLSGSTAVMTALVAGLLEWMERTEYELYQKSNLWINARKSPYMLAETVRHIELYFLKIVCGYQDAYMCAFGSLNFLDFRDKDKYLTLDREPLGTVEDLAKKSPKLPILLAHTGIQRVSGAVHKPVRDRWIEGDHHVVSGVLRLAHIARMSKEAILSGDLEYLGEAMTENHEIVKSFGSSSDINERYIDIALDSGAIAAKLAGAGKGGTIIALHEDPESLGAAMKEAGVKTVLYPVAADGARREIQE